MEGRGQCESSGFETRRLLECAKLVTGEYEGGEQSCNGVTEGWSVYFGGGLYKPHLNLETEKKLDQWILALDEPI